MKSGFGRLLARSLRDVTSVRAEDLREERVAREAVPGEAPQENPQPARCQVIAIVSGKGGTGKTVFTTNIAVLLARAGLKVTLFDADLGLANAHLLLGLAPHGDISSLLTGEAHLSDIAVEGPYGLKLIPGGSGVSELADLSDRQLRIVAHQFMICEQNSDVILVDLSAGISPQVLRFMQASHDSVVVTTPDVTAMLDAYATIKAFNKVKPGVPVHLVVNRVKDRIEAVATYKKIREVAVKRIGNVEVSFFGWLPQNWYIQDSVSKREPVVLLHPKSFVTACLAKMGEQFAALNNDWRTTEDETFSSKLSGMVFE